MLALRWGRVLAVTATRPGVQELVTDRGAALCYPSLTGPAARGDRVLLNVLAAVRGLGTGGYHLVAQLGARQTGTGAGPGRNVKLRYTPWQIPVVAGEAEAALPPHLGGMPVVAGSLHSQLAPAAAGFKLTAAGARLAYVMTDGAALPVWLSRLVADLRARSLIDSVITAGQAFGGDIEAVGIPSALQLARGPADCAAAICCMGPGIVGTGTLWGHTAVEQAWVVQAATALGGRPIAIPRLGSADPRPRHRGLSHHSLAALGLLASSAALVAIPNHLDPGVVRPLAQRHAIVAVRARAVYRAVRRLLPQLSTMGRGWTEEGPLFDAAVAAGVLAGMLALQNAGPSGPGLVAG